jgi:hypothetical protein
LPEMTDEELREEQHMMAVRRPIDADVPFSLIGHIFLQFEPRATVTSTDPCTGKWSAPQGLLGRSRALGKQGTAPARTPHGASITANSTGHASRANRLDLGELRRFGPSSAACIQEPYENGTGLQILGVTNRRAGWEEP